MKTIIISGLGRSGTTILAETLDRHKGFLAMPSSIYPIWLHCYKGKNIQRVISMINHLSVVDIITPDEGQYLKTCIDFTNECWKNKLIEQLVKVAAKKVGREEKIEVVVWKCNRFATLCREWGSKDSKVYVIHTRRPIEEVFASVRKTWESKSNLTSRECAYWEHSFLATLEGDKPINSTIIETARIKERITDVVTWVYPTAKPIDRSQSWGKIVGERYPKVHGRVGDGFCYVERTLPKKLKKQLLLWNKVFSLIYSVPFAKKLDFILRKAIHRKRISKPELLTIGE